MNPTFVLLIDDDTSYSKSLSAESGLNSINLICSRNLKEGIETLLANRRIKAVILDGHCRLNNDQPGEPKTNFVFHALQQIRDLEHEHNRLIPFCVSSEKPDAFGDDLSGIAPIFRKGDDHNKMFGFLKEQIRILPDSIIRNKYEDIFENIDLVFDGIEEDLLIDLIQAATLHDPLAIDANLASIRRLLEKLADQCYKTFINPKITKSVKLKGGFLKMTFQSLSDRYLLPRELMSSAFFIYSFCSEHGSHSNLDMVKVNYEPNRYSYQRVLFSFLELLAYCIVLLKRSPVQVKNGNATPTDQYKQQ